MLLKEYGVPGTSHKNVERAGKHKGMSTTQRLASAGYLHCPTPPLARGAAGGEVCAPKIEATLEEAQQKLSREAGPTEGPPLLPEMPSKRGSPPGDSSFPIPSQASYWPHEEEQPVVRAAWEMWSQGKGKGVDVAALLMPWARD